MMGILLVTVSDGMAGSIIMDAASIFFLGGILIYTSLYRKRGRLDDKLFLAMIIINMELAVADGISYVVEGATVHGARALLIFCNIVFYSAFEIFLYVYLLYLDFRTRNDAVRIRKMKLPAFIPCFIMLVILFVNLKTGWIFSIDSNCMYHSGKYNTVVFIPAACYFLLSLMKVMHINFRLVLMGIFLVGIRFLLGIWFRDISSTAFTYTLFLVCTHVHVMNQPLNEEKE